MNWYFEVLRKYAVFTGRARRKEYWLFAFFNYIIAFVLGLIGAMSGTYGSPSFVRTLVGLYCLAVFIPSLAVQVRRLHDTDHSGWWIFISLVPIIGFIIMLAFNCTDSTPGDNRYGQNPKGVREIVSTV